MGMNTEWKKKMGPKKWWTKEEDMAEKGKCVHRKDNSSKKISPKEEVALDKSYL
jgi:hypothetical protein